MNLYNNGFLYILIMSSFCTGCVSYTSTSKTDTTTTIVTKTTRGPELPPSDWHGYNFPHETIYIPVKWHFLDQDEFFFKASINSNDRNTYFQVIKENKSEEDGPALLKRFYLFLKKGSIGTLDSSSAINIVYKDKTVLNSEFHLKIENEKYVIYSTIFEKDANLFEFRFEIPEKKFTDLKQTSVDILYNFYHDKKLVFTDKDQILSAKVLNFNSM